MPVVVLAHRDLHLPLELHSVGCEITSFFSSLNAVVLVVIVVVVVVLLLLLGSGRWACGGGGGASDASRLELREALVQSAAQLRWAVELQVLRHVAGVRAIQVVLVEDDVHARHGPVITVVHERVRVVADER
eukprot:553929-Prymnesium_polylepis.1